MNTLCTDERVHEILDADIVLAYYEKMYEHFEKNPKDFLFPNREWLRESLKRLKVDLSGIFDKDANVDHIKREEVIIITKLNEDFLKEQERQDTIRSRNTKFVIKEFFGFSNKEYKAYLKKYNKKDELHGYHFRSYYENIIHLSELNVDTEFILESMYMSKLDSKKLIAVLLKLKEKINE